jgi:hypothetical protein
MSLEPTVNLTMINHDDGAPVQNQLPATGRPSDTPHAERAMRGCACVQCEYHRTRELGEVVSKDEQSILRRTL